MFRVSQSLRVFGQCGCKTKIRRRRRCCFAICFIFCLVYLLYISFYCTEQCYYTLSEETHHDTASSVYIMAYMGMVLYCAVVFLDRILDFFSLSLLFWITRVKNVNTKRQLKEISAHKKKKHTETHTKYIRRKLVCFYTILIWWASIA